ncbi:MAG: HGGxSTG domain-containing protein [Paracoccaceae bacterium]
MIRVTKSNVKPWLYGPDWQGTLCGARTRAGSPCRRPGTKRNGKCRLHGGSTVGPATLSGLASLAGSKITHGKQTAAARAKAKRRAEVVVSSCINSDR